MDGIHAVLIGKKVFKLFDPAKNEKFFPRKKFWYEHSFFGDHEDDKKPL
jgi:hypothetical protein